jgi:hypothetical protein
MTRGELEALVLEGLTVAEIAERAGWQLSTTYTALSAHGLSARRGPRGVTARHHLIVQPVSWHLTEAEARAALDEELVGGRVMRRWVVGRLVGSHVRGWRALQRAMAIGGVVIRPEGRLKADETRN